MVDLNDPELQLSVGIGNVCDGSCIIEVKDNWFMDDISLFYYKDKIVIFGEEDYNIESRFDEKFIKIVYTSLILETNRVFLNVQEEMEKIKHKVFRLNDIYYYYYVNDGKILYKLGEREVKKINFSDFIYTMFHEFFNKGFGVPEKYFVEDDEILEEFKKFLKKNYFSLNKNAR